jgi:hypothetical protein
MSIFGIKYGDSVFLDRFVAIYQLNVTITHRSKLEYAFVAWNSVTITHFNKLELIQRKFAALSHNKYFSRCGISLLQYIGKFKFGDTIHLRRRHFDA